MKILVVEDEPLISMSLIVEIEDLGYETLGPAVSVGSALQFIGQNQADMALLDIDLEQPGDGLSLAAILRSRAVPVIFISGQIELMKRNAHLAIGYIAKPYVPADVAESIAVVAAIVRGIEPPPPRVPGSFHRL